MSSDILIPNFDEIKTHLNHQLSFSPHSNQGHILVDDKHYTVVVDKDGHLFSPEKLEGYDFYDGKSYIGHYKDLQFSPSISGFFGSILDFFQNLFSRKNKYNSITNNYDVRNTTTCRDTETNCENVGGRCYYMAAMSFLAKSAYAFREAGVVSRQFEAAIDFAFEMTACSYNKQQEYCMMLPSTMYEINRRYLKIRKQRDNPIQITEGGSPGALLQAILSTVKGGVCEFLYFSEDRKFFRTYSNRWCNSHVRLYTIEINKKISNTVDFKKHIDDAVSILKKDSNIIVLGGVISVPNHAIGFNICTDNIITVCDPNLDGCWIAGDTTSSFPRPLYFKSYGTINNLEIVAIKKGKYVPYRVNDRVSVKYNDNTFYLATVIRVIDEENVVLKYEEDGLTEQTNLNEWEVTPIKKGWF